MGGPWRGCAPKKFSRGSVFAIAFVPGSGGVFARVLSVESKSMLKPLSHGVGVPAGVRDGGGTTADDVHSFSVSWPCWSTSRKEGEVASPVNFVGVLAGDEGGGCLALDCMLRVIAAEVTDTELFLCALDRLALWRSNWLGVPWFDVVREPGFAFRAGRDFLGLGLASRQSPA